MILKPIYEFRCQEYSDKKRENRYHYNSVSLTNKK